MFTDRFAAEYFDDMIRRLRVRTVVETGTYRGHSALEFATRVPHVITIEADATYYAQAAFFVRRPNLQRLLGSSPDVIAGLRGIEERCCFFLDAHWRADWPLLAELRAIAGLCRSGVLRETPVVLIHDFKVPGCPDLGYDSYGGQDLDWAYVRDDALAICPTYAVSYNDRAEGRRRGILRLEPAVHARGGAAL